MRQEHDIQKVIRKFRSMNPWRDNRNPFRKDRVVLVLCHPVSTWSTEGDILDVIIRRDYAPINRCAMASPLAIRQSSLVLFHKCQITVVRWHTEATGYRLQSLFKIPSYEEATSGSQASLDCTRPDSDLQ